MKLLFFGDAATTGFGSVTMDLGRALLNLGVDVRFVSQNDLPELPEPFASRTIDQTAFTLVQAEDDPDGVGGVDLSRLPKFLPLVLSGKATDYKMCSGAGWGDWKPDNVLLLGDFYGMRGMADPFL